MIEFHPFADLFPLVEEHVLAEIREDIRANGIHDAIEIYDDKILDGRTRYRCLQELLASGEPRGAGWGVYEGTPVNVEDLTPSPDVPWFKRFSSMEHGDPLRYVISRNLHRRHLTDDQRRMIAAKLVTAARGRPEVVNFAEREINRENAAELLSVDVAGVDRARAITAHGTEELNKAVEHGQLSVNAGAQIAMKPEEEQRRDLTERGILPDGARSIMASRQEPDDSLDFFPTPPWATRALAQHVLPAVGVAGKRFGVAWEPACGEGHIAAVIDEYADRVIATDVFDYGYGAVQDFLAVDLDPPQVDWIVTNPPFSDLAMQFVDRSLSMLRQGRVSTGVAMFFRSQWAVEGIERYEEIFRDHPPTLCAFFVERVNLCKGRWDPDGSTATAYCWLIWLRDGKPLPTFWVPPGCRVALSKSEDRERFTAHPVMGNPIAASDEGFDPETGEIFDSPPTKAALRASLTNEAAESAETGGSSREDGGERAEALSTERASAAPIPISAASTGKVGVVIDERASLDPAEHSACVVVEGAVSDDVVIDKIADVIAKHPTIPLANITKEASATTADKRYPGRISYVSYDQFAKPPFIDVITEAGLVDPDHIEAHVQRTKEDHPEIKVWHVKINGVLVEVPTSNGGDHVATGPAAESEAGRTPASDSDDEVDKYGIRQPPDIPLNMRRAM